MLSFQSERSGGCRYLEEGLNAGRLEMIGLGALTIAIAYHCCTEHSLPADLLRGEPNSRQRALVSSAGIHVHSSSAVRIRTPAVKIAFAFVPEADHKPRILKRW